MDNFDSQKSQASLDKLSNAVDELLKTVQTQKQRYLQEIEAKSNKINGLQTEIQNLNHALTNRKAQLEEMETKMSLLSGQFEATKQQLSKVEQNGGEELAQVKKLLETERAQSAQLAAQYAQAQADLQQSKICIEQTSTKIDDVITKLEKVLEDNGASDNKNC